MNGLFETSNPILVKEALKLVGFPVGGVRLPLIDATAEQSARLRIDHARGRRPLIEYERERPQVDCARRWIAPAGVRVP